MTTEREKLIERAQEALDYIGPIADEDREALQYCIYYAALAQPAGAQAKGENVVLALLSDVEAALIDLHACDDANCTETNCLHVLPRIRALLAER